MGTNDFWVRDLAHYFLTGQRLGKVIVRDNEKELLDVILERLEDDDDSGRTDQETDPDTELSR